MRTSLESALKEFRRQVRHSRRRGDAASIHRLRVVSRRLVVWCELLEILGAGSRASEARRRVKRMLRSLARLRDLHVQRQLLATVPSALKPAARILRRELRREQPERARRVHARCRGLHPSRICRLILEAAGATPIGATPVAPESDARLVRDLAWWLAGLEREARHRLQAARAAKPETLHCLRIAVKHLRYGLELAWTADSRAPDAAARRLRDLQAVLGEIQDADVCRALVLARVESHPDDARQLVPLQRWLERRRDARIRRVLRRRRTLLPAVTPAAGGSG